MFELAASLVLGFVKGFAGGVTRDESSSLSLQRDVLGPLKEEAVYRAGPLWAFPNLPFGSTAVVFAADHALDALKDDGTTPGRLVARFGEVMLGGLLYESAYRRSGYVAAVTAHSLHNAACAWGAALRGR